MNFIENIDVGVYYYIAFMGIFCVASILDKITEGKGR